MHGAEMHVVLRVVPQKNCFNIAPHVINFEFSCKLSVLNRSLEEAL